MEEQAVDLPPLPKAAGKMPYAPPNTRLWYEIPSWNADQMQAYARAAVLAARRTGHLTEAEVMNAARCAGLDEEQWLRLKAYFPIRSGLPSSPAT